MQYYLCTIGDSGIWDLSRKLVMLGPWCLIDPVNAELLKSREYHILASPWFPATKVKDASDYCHSIYERLLPKLAEVLNSFHGLNFPLRYWKIVLGYWLLHFIEVSFDRYKRLATAFNEFPDSYTFVLPVAKCDIRTVDTNDFFENQVNDDLYNLKLFSLISHYLFIDKIKEVGVNMNFESGKPGMMGYSWKGKLFNKLLNSISIFLKGPVLLSEMYHLKSWDIFLLVIKHPGFFSSMNFNYINDESLKERYSLELRKGLFFANSVDDGFEKALTKILPYAIPMCYLENFELYRTGIDKYSDSIKVVGSATAWYFNERFKLFAAEAGLKGAKLVEFQHGGGYGTTFVLPAETSASQKDIFYSWGWTGKNNSNIEPLPSSHLSKLRDSYSCKSNKIIFVGNGTLRFLYRFDTQFCTDNVKDYFKDKIIFLDNLTGDIRNDVIYRPFLHEFGWQEQRFIKDAYPKMPFLLGSNLCNWMSKAKLVVIDHAATSFLEVLTINAPCVLFWDHKINLMKPEAEGYFDLLRSSGILYKDPISAAKKVNEIFHNPIEWWQSKEVQDARIKFCEKFAYARKDWLKVWMNEFSKLKEGRIEYN